MSDSIRQRPASLSSTPMSSTQSPTTDPTAEPPPLTTAPTTSTSTPSTPSSSSSSSTITTRHRPIKSINTLHAPNPPKKTHPPALSSSASASRTPRSPFGAWTGSPCTPLAPHFATQAPTQVVALLVLAVVYLGVFVVVTVRDLGAREGWRLGLGGWRDVGGQEVGEGERELLRMPGLDHGGVELLVGVGDGVSVAKAFVPEFPLTRLAVRDHHEFQDDGEVGHEAWVNMFPKGNRQVRVDEPRKCGLPRSERLMDKQGRYVGEAEMFEVAVVRELECLLVIRDVLVRWEDVMVHDGEGKVLEEWERQDARRCLDHLRQAILCHSDTTLERVGRHQGQWQSRAQSPNEFPHVDMDGSVGTVRTCKDWEHVRNWVEENRADRDLDRDL